MGQIIRMISDYLSSNIIICIFYLTHFRELGQKCRNIFIRFLVQMKALNFAFEIKWPLRRKKNQNANEESRKKPASLKKQKFLMSFFALERFWKAARQSKSFPSYFFSLPVFSFFSATDFSSAFQFQTQNIIFCSSDPELWQSDNIHNGASYLIY